MAANTRSEAQRDEDLEQTAAYYLAGKTQREIAQLIGVTQAQISYDLATIRKRWRESALVDFNEAKNRELERIDHLEREARDAWERSRQPAEVEITSSEQIPMGEGVIEGGRIGKIFQQRLKAQRRKEGQVGDPRFLERIAWCISERCRILGLYAQDGSTKTPIDIHIHQAMVQVKAGLDRVPVAELERLETEIETTIQRYQVQPAQPQLSTPANVNGTRAQ
jgi:hypothetical protein